MLLVSLQESSKLSDPAILVLALESYFLRLIRNEPEHDNVVVDFVLILAHVPSLNSGFDFLDFLEIKIVRCSGLINPTEQLVESAALLLGFFLVFGNYRDLEIEQL